MDDTIVESAEARKVKESAMGDKCAAVVQQMLIKAGIANPLKAVFAYTSCLPMIMYLDFYRCRKPGTFG